MFVKSTFINDFSMLFTNFIFSPNQGIFLTKAGPILLSLGKFSYLFYRNG